jgi:hypothetical protein
MRTLVIAAAAALLVSGCGNNEEGTRGAATSPYALPQSDGPVELDPADFVPTIDNRYWPMAPGSRWVYREVDADGSRQHVEVTVTNQTKTILGITATVVHDRVTADGELVAWGAPVSKGPEFKQDASNSAADPGATVGHAQRWRNIFSDHRFDAWPACAEQRIHR